MPLPELDFPSASGAIGTSALLPATGANLCASSTTQKSKRSIEQVAELEGRVMATELELEQIAAKRQEHERYLSMQMRQRQREISEVVPWVC